MPSIKPFEVTQSFHAVKLETKLESLQTKQSEMDLTVSIFDCLNSCGRAHGKKGAWQKGCAVKGRMVRGAHGGRACGKKGAQSKGTW